MSNVYTYCRVTRFSQQPAKVGPKGHTVATVRELLYSNPTQRLSTHERKEVKARRPSRLNISRKDLYPSTITTNFKFES